MILRPRITKEKLAALIKAVEEGGDDDDEITEDEAIAIPSPSMEASPHKTGRTTTMIRAIDAIAKAAQPSEIVHACRHRRSQLSSQKNKSNFRLGAPFRKLA